MQAIGAQYPYDHCGYGAGHQAAVAERVRHREYPRAQTSFQQMYQSLRVSAKNSNFWKGRDWVRSLFYNFSRTIPYSLDIQYRI